MLQATITPVAVGAEDAGERGFAFEGAVEIPADEEAGLALEVHLRDAVTGAVETAEDVCSERRLDRPRQEAGAYQYLVAQCRRARLPASKRLIVR
jgi:hypothetical protein